MSAANYEFCPICDQKALYVGEEDMPDDLVVLHKTCQELALAEAVAAEQAKITRVLELAAEFDAEDGVLPSAQGEDSAITGHPVTRGDRIRAVISAAVALVHYTPEEPDQPACNAGEDGTPMLGTLNRHQVTCQACRATFTPAYHG